MTGPPSPASARSPATGRGHDRFTALYDEHFDFVWRSLWRLGVREAAFDDALQEVFVVVHRRLDDFEGRSSLRTWLFSIALGVARNHRRQLRRKGEPLVLSEDVPDPGPGPHEQVVRSEALREVDRLLEALDEDRRAVFILVELEQMTAPEVADALGLNLNTVYSRLRLARQDFENALARHRRRTP
jgi:RNA polymerase sigma-70 factor (ECF subfamily)